MPFTYVVADLHGRRDLLDMALDAVAARGGGTVVLTGDYVDRGPQSRQVIERLMAGPPPGQRWICLKGNHEDILLQACGDPGKLDWWLGNGGGATLGSYAGRPGNWADVAAVPQDHLRWFAALPLIHTDPHRVYVHAGVDPDQRPDQQTEEVLLWMRHAPGDARGYGSRHVVHGHTPVQNGPLLLPGRTNLDTLAWRTGRLVVGAFDDGRPGGPAELIELRAAPHA